MAAPEVRYAGSDGVHIAYQVLGSGAHDVMFVTNWATNTEAMWDHPAVAASWERVSRWARVIIFDQRGSGLSDRMVEATRTIEDWAEDITLVLDVVGSERVSLCGTSLSSPIAIAYAAMHPDRVATLTLLDASARLVDAPGYDVGLPERLRDRAIEFLAAGWGDPDSDFARLALPGDDRDEDRRAQARLQRLSLSPDTVRQRFRAAFDLDVRELLPSVQAPTLVAHHAGNALLSPKHSQYVADHIPNATYLELPGHDAFALEQAERWEAEMQAFITGVRPETPTDRVLLTIVFTDIVDSTQRLAAVGDLRWRNIIDRHDATVRAELTRFHGREVSTAGDSFLAAFDGPAKAIRWAATVRDRLGEDGIAIRAGAHSGEVVLRGDDVSGIAVVIAARIQALAQPGEILVSSTVRDLVAGSGISFDDRGFHELKGVPEQRQVFRVESVW